ncbi:hypothetical protein LQR31_16540 [Chromobacterium vaccinii]|uniref:hypothetical protein n=1 Tax=Chromobacterium vaccinii TaxID=1108595 RepID=UPI001E6435AC|nr:hypothetical protein [Chromobacterium vaccinii]MCD4486083.1 hypothetical protein [Chromobacterium vaccinii]MCD4498408.1 hypothetical protein [Chromobacterium vaccinii]
MRMSRSTLLALLALSAAPQIHAAACTANANVQTSAKSDADNRAAGGKGGHVGLHMRNAALPLPPSGAQSQIDKSVFENWAAFKQSFDKWSKDTTKPHVNCGASGGPKDIVDASLVGVTQGWKCTKAGGNGLCETWQKFTPVKVCFWYYNAPGSGGTAGKWLLNTAYPSLNADCS